MPERRSTKSPAVGGAGEEGLSCRMLPSDFYINSGFTSAVPDFHVGSALALLDNDLIPIASSAANCCIRFAHAVFSASRTDTGLVTDLDGACRDRNQRGARERDRECQCLCCSHLFLLLINPMFGERESKDWSSWNEHLILRRAYGSSLRNSAIVRSDCSPAATALVGMACGPGRCRPSRPTEYPKHGSIPWPIDGGDRLRSAASRSRAPLPHSVRH